MSGASVGRLAALGIAAAFVAVGSLYAEGSPDGAALYQSYCALCHGADGRGVPSVFPPLAGSDFLAKERERALLAPLEGLKGPITVNGVEYKQAMLPVALDDAQIAAVFAYVFRSWGNSVHPPTEAEIRALRARTAYPTYEALVASLQGPAPSAPEGWEWLSPVDLPFSPVRLVAHPDGKRVLVLAQIGDVWECDPATGMLRQRIWGQRYIDPAFGTPSVLGMGFDRHRRLYLAVNQLNRTPRPVTNEVTIFRTTPWPVTDEATEEAGTPVPEVWYRTRYPFGVGPYNHGVSRIAEGPDEAMYVTSGSRTDGGEAGTKPEYSTNGEEPETATIWRFAPPTGAKSSGEGTPAPAPVRELFAHGLRNTFGFCWDTAGRMIGVENGPDADAPEELNWIQQGRHYGFPYTFADWTDKAYPHTPEPPAGVRFERPFRSVPWPGLPPVDGGDKSFATFLEHSCPTGIIYLDRDWPEPMGDSFLIVRFGNLIRTQGGFDLLQARLDFDRGTAEIRRLAAPLGRPIDLLPWRERSILVAEYCRGTTFEAGLGTPGRLRVLRRR